mmetsp:Transcript_62376/g.165532  ORF Transcript_62376/g.165532 Transcript_62376/m.165532 type:complete len:254 (-) Transcript_62376:502-1263(-)
MATCDKASTACAAGRSTATMPAGMSSQPVRVSVNATHGACPWASAAGRALMTCTAPTAVPPWLTTSHGPKPAARRSSGWSTRRHCATSRSVRQRAASSPKEAKAAVSGLKTAPGCSPARMRLVAQDCSSSATRSARPAQTRESRSQAAVMRRHHGDDHLSTKPWSPSDRRRKRSTPCFKESPCRERQRSLSRCAIKPQTSSALSFAISRRSTARRSSSSRATSSIMISRAQVHGSSRLRNSTIFSTTETLPRS